MDRTKGLGWGSWSPLTLPLKNKWKLPLIIIIYNVNIYPNRVKFVVWHHILNF